MNLKKIALLGGVGLASAAVGVVIPQVMKGQSHDVVDGATSESPAGHESAGAEKKDKKEKEKKAAKADDHGSSGHGAAGHGTADGKAETKKTVDGPCFISFGRIIVNLNDPTLTRYLSLEVTLQAEGMDEEDVKLAIETRKPILQTWLTSHLADKTIEDVRGKVGVNRLRREIQDNFNSLLFTDGRERIQDILFEEFHVQ